MKRRWATTVILGGLFGLVGCAAEPAGNPQGASNDPQSNIAITNASGGSVLATLTKGGHTVRFERTASGGIVLAELAPIGEKPLLAGHAGSASELYSKLADGAAAPAALTEAVSAVANAPAQNHSSSMTAPPQKPIWRTEASPALTPDQQWFQGAFCSQWFIQSCDISSGSSINGSLDEFVYSPNYYSYAMNDSWNAGTASMNEYLWTGSSWQLDWSSPTLNPGDTLTFNWWNSGPVYRSTDLVIEGGGAGGVSQGGITPTLDLTYVEANVFDFQYANTFPFDDAVDCYVSGIHIINGGNSIVNIETAIQGLCPPQQWYNGNPQPAYCRGRTTGQTATTTVVAPFFGPGNCCRSIGGNNLAC